MGRFRRSVVSAIALSAIYGFYFPTKSKVLKTFLRFYRILIFLSIILIFVSQKHVILHWISGDKFHSLDSFLQFAKISIAWITYLSCYVVTCYKMRGVQDTTLKLVYSTLPLSDEAFKTIFYTSLIGAIFYSLEMTGFQVLAVYLTPPIIKHYYSIPMYVFLEMIQVSVVINFSVGVLLIKSITKAVDLKLGDLSSRTSHFDANQFLGIILTCKKTHLKLHELSQIWMQHYQLQLLTIVAKNFVELTYSLAIYVDKISAANVLSLVLLLWGGLGNAFILLQLCIMCQLASSEMLNLRRTVFNALERTNDDDERLELRLFSHQVHHLQVNFSVFGIFKLDNDFIFRLFVSTATYIAIILSFQFSR